MLIDSACSFATTTADEGRQRARATGEGRSGVQWISRSRPLGGTLMNEQTNGTAMRVTGHGTWSGSDRHGRAASRKDIVFAHAALGRRLGVERLGLVVVEGVAGVLDVEREPVAAGDRRATTRRRPRSG